MKRATRYSKKREAILAAIYSTDCHPSAEWLYQTLKPRYPDLSLGTIYRNLLLFQEQGLVRSVGVHQGQERYDGVMEPHAHFVCRRCGSVVDLRQINLDVELNRTVSEQYGFSVERRELTFYGLCPDCIQKDIISFEEEFVP